MNNQQTKQGKEESKGIIEEVQKLMKKKAEEFGAEESNYIFRENTGNDALKDGGAFFGFIRPEEEKTGKYHDFSLIILPSAEENKDWLICLGVGLNGFKNDYELATLPGPRRLFSRLIDENGFCKSDFSDIETKLPKSFTDKLPHMKETLKVYSKVLLVCQIFNPFIKNNNSDEKGDGSDKKVNAPDGKSDSSGGDVYSSSLDEKATKIIRAFVAAYAKLREWPSSEKHRKAVSEALGPSVTTNQNEIEEVKNLLEKRKYVVLQGPPGTGKTRTAKLVAETLIDKGRRKIFFTQFHAETSYSDFIYGIRPNIKQKQLSYTGHNGIFSLALNHAIKHQNEKVILIIDEINRANLSNVLGPIFYLFEHKMDVSNVKISITPKLTINKLPDNFYVIATMNTADRSLAVVDFALRRRFAWYTIKPQPIKEPKFYLEDFNRIQEIFEWYASSTELNLQPGQGYFIANDEDEMKNRIRYEIFPLIKEYLQEGLLLNAKEEFNKYFLERINLPLFE